MVHKANPPLDANSDVIVTTPTLGNYLKLNASLDWVNASFDSDVGNATAVALNTAKITYPALDSGKLALIEAQAKDDQTGAEIRTLFSAESNTNVLTDTLLAKLNSIDANHYGDPVQTTIILSALAEASLVDKVRRYVEDETSDYFYDITAVSGDIAPDDQTGGTGFWRKTTGNGDTSASIKVKYESNPDTNVYNDADQTKVAGLTVADLWTGSGADVYRSAGKVGILMAPIFTSLDVARAGNDAVALLDNRIAGTGVGGGVFFGGNYTGFTPTTWASIVGTKENATDGNFAGKLAFLTRPHGGAHTEQLTILSDGNIGIGDTAPANYGNHRTLSIKGLNNTDGGVIDLKTLDASIHLQIVANSQGFAFNGATNHKMEFKTNGLNRLVLASAGDVTVSTGKLHLPSDSYVTLGGAFVFGNQGTAVAMRANTGSGLFFENSSASIKMTMTNDGNLGIGITPAYVLHMSKTVDNTLAVATKVSDFNTSTMLLHNQDNPGTGNKSALFFSFSGGGGLASGMAGYKESGSWKTGLDFYVNNITGVNVLDIQHAMRINPDGNVGIGTSNPTARLELNGTSNIRFITTASAVFVQTDGDDLTFGTRIADHVTILSGGNVGVGYTAPSSKVHVNGDIRCSAGYVSDSGFSYFAGLRISGSATNSIYSGSVNLDITAEATQRIRMGFSNSNTTGINITGNGSLVAIGKATATSMFDVEGRALALRHDDKVVVKTAGTIDINCDVVKFVGVSLTTNSTINAPTNPVDGQHLLFRLIQDATGSRTINWNAVFQTSTSVSDISPDSTANSVTFIMFSYIASTNKWRAISKGT